MTKYLNHFAQVYAASNSLFGTLVWKISRASISELACMQHDETNTNFRLFSLKLKFKLIHTNVRISCFEIFTVIQIYKPVIVIFRYTHNAMLIEVNFPLLCQKYEQK